MRSGRPFITIICIVLFLCALTAGQIYLLYKSSLIRPENDGIHHNEVSAPVDMSFVQK
jgi:hypothetical protein